MRRLWGVVPVLIVSLGGACAPREADRLSGSDRSYLSPTFAPSTSDVSRTTAPVVASEGPTGPADGLPDSTASPKTTGGGSGGASMVPVPAFARVDDQVGDVTMSPSDPPPDWADLRGAMLSRVGSEFELVVDLNGDVPARAPDTDRTMNVASFFDLDGDGQIDVEVWVNLADDGWGGAYFDDRSRSAEFADDSRVVARVEQGRLVVRFPSAHLDDATAFRWSIASEWGRFETIGTDLAARDDAPGGDASVDFPG